MKRTLVLFLATALLLVTARRLPAPISEVQETPPTQPAAAKIKPTQKSKPTEAESTFSSQSPKRFNGTWACAQSGTQHRGESMYKTAATLVINDGVADVSKEVTLVLLPAKTWNWLPDRYKKISPVYFKAKWHSTDLNIDGSNLSIRWAVAELLDWSPKAIPQNVIQASLSTPHTSVYTFRGKRLTRDFDTNGDCVFTRANR